jgi:3-isopropylmalate/(R)-2-methylmalate dehydratase small subunit
MIFEGKAHTFGRNVNTDVIFPKRYFKAAYEEGEMGRHAMAGIDPDFYKKVAKGDIIVGGPNFGCGSGREEAAGCLRELGIAAVVAPSFGRLFTRNCVNLGVPAITCEGIDEITQDGDEMVVDLTKGIVRNLRLGIEKPVPAMADELLRLLKDGGIAAYTRRVLAERQQGSH